MDVADAFATSFDRLEGLSPDPLRIADIQLDDDYGNEVRELQDQMIRTAEVSGARLGDATDARDTLVLCHAADAALKVANPWYWDATESALANLLVDRYEESGRLDTGAPGGAVLPKWGEPRRPSALPERLDDWFHYAVRVRPGRESQVFYEPARTPGVAADALDREELRAGHSTVGCVSFIDDFESHLSVARIDRSGIAFYALAPRQGARDADHVATVASRLADSAVLLGVLPEASLHPDLIGPWQEHIQSATRGGNRPCYVLIGTGPSTDSSPDPHVTPPPNRAVVIDRYGRIVLIQDKQSGFTMPESTASTWALGPDFDDGGPFGEWMTPGRTLNVLETPIGRVAILVCEDLARVGDFAPQVREWGISLVLAPILSSQLSADRWEAADAKKVILEGATVIVANSTAVEHWQRAQGRSDRTGQIHCCLVAPGASQPHGEWPPLPRLGATDHPLKVAVLPLPPPLLEDPPGP